MPTYKCPEPFVCHSLIVTLPAEIKLPIITHCISQSDTHSSVNILPMERAIGLPVRAAVLLLESPHACWVCLHRHICRLSCKTMHSVTLLTAAIMLTVRAADITLQTLFSSELIYFCRWIAYRQVAVRTFAALYIGMNAVYLYPRYAKEAFSFAWPWLLRYSNAWVLLMTAVGLMVSVCPSQFSSCCWHLLKCARFCSPFVCSLVQLSPLVATFGYDETRSCCQSQVGVVHSETSVLHSKSKLRTPGTLKTPFHAGAHTYDWLTCWSLGVGTAFQVMAIYDRVYHICT